MSYTVETESTVENTFVIKVTLPLLRSTLFTMHVCWSWFITHIIKIYLGGYVSWVMTLCQDIWITDPSTYHKLWKIKSSNNYFIIIIIFHLENKHDKLNISSLIRTIPWTTKIYWIVIRIAFDNSITAGIILIISKCWRINELAIAWDHSNITEICCFPFTFPWKMSTSHGRTWFTFRKWNYSTPLNLRSSIS